MEIKKCIKCEVIQNVENFYERKTRGDRKTICKGCESKQKAKPLEFVPDLKGEEWKDVEGYEGIYIVSNFSRVKRIMHRKNPTNTLMKGTAHREGYFFFALRKDNICKNVPAHRMVAKAFIPNPENKPQVNHINGIKTDNRSENLEWNTAKENIRHSWKNGMSSIKKGEQSNRAVLTEKDVLEIRASNLRPRELAKIYGIGEASIGKIINRKRWTHI